MAEANNVDDTIDAIKKFDAKEAKEFREKIVHDSKNFDVLQIVSTGIKQVAKDDAKKKSNKVSSEETSTEETTSTESTEETTSTESTEETTSTEETN